MGLGCSYRHNTAFQLPFTPDVLCHRPISNFHVRNEHRILMTAVIEGCRGRVTWRDRCHRQILGSPTCLISARNPEQMQTNPPKSSLLATSFSRTVPDALLDLNLDAKPGVIAAPISFASHLHAGHLESRIQSRAICGEPIDPAESWRLAPRPFPTCRGLAAVANFSRAFAIFQWRFTKDAWTVAEPITGRITRARGRWFVWQKQDPTTNARPRGFFALS
jgi:hypothetical protein